MALNQASEAVDRLLEKQRWRSDFVWEPAGDTFDDNDKAVYDCPLKVYTCQVDDSYVDHRIPDPGSNLRDCGS